LRYRGHLLVALVDVVAAADHDDAKRAEKRIENPVAGATGVVRHEKPPEVRFAPKPGLDLRKNALEGPVVP
jgi:hypothetical protein